MSAGNVFERVITDPERLKDRMVDAFVYAKALMESGRKVHIVIKEGLDPITARQRKFLRDVVCQQIAEQAFTGPTRTRFTKKVWHDYFRERILGSHWEMVQKPGEPEPIAREVENSSEALGVQGYADYTDEVIQIATEEFGVHFVFEVDQREQTRPRRRAEP